MSLNIPYVPGSNRCAEKYRSGSRLQHFLCRFPEDMSWHYYIQQVFMSNFCTLGGYTRLANEMCIDRGGKLSFPLVLCLFRRTKSDD